MLPALRLVCSDRPEGRILSCLDPPSTQAVFPLRVRGVSISVQGPPLRAVPVASCLHQDHGGSPCSVKGKRYSHSQLPRRLAHTDPVSSTVVRTQGHGAQSPQPVGASGQLGKEQTLPCNLAAIAARHEVVDNKSVGKHDLIIRFLRGARRLNLPYGLPYVRCRLSVHMCNLHMKPPMCRMWLPLLGKASQCYPYPLYGIAVAGISA